MEFELDKYEEQQEIVIVQMDALKFSVYFQLMSVSTQKSNTMRCEPHSRTHFF